MDRESPSRQRNREIRDAESRLRRLADLMLVGVLLFRRDGSLDYVNRAAREILDMPDPEDPGWRELGSLMSGALRSAWEEGREDGRMELDWTTEESSRRLRFQINFVDEEDCRGFVVLVRDREVLSALDADLGVAAQLRNLSRLYLGLAHDLRSPLHTVGLHLELVTSAVERGEGDSEEVVEWLRVAREQVDRLSSGVDILLAQAVLPAARPEPFDLGTWSSPWSRCWRARPARRRSGSPSTTHPSRCRWWPTGTGSVRRSLTWW